ncbi:MAG: hypothetical protein GY845_07875 [Planctomycetes bacterium]|nr:hypothetical protein [Planctomycetota bacterium]
MKIAIVLSMGLTGLGVTRSLGRQGIEVYGIDEESAAMAFSSKYCKKAFVFPSPVAHPEECLAKFVELGQNLDGKAVLLPTSDYYVSFVSRFRNELSNYFLFNIPEPSILEILVDKSKQYELAEKMGILIPKTFPPYLLMNCSKKKKRCHTRCLLKERMLICGNPSSTARGLSPVLLMI